MIRSTSEAICETLGSMIVKLGAKNHNLQPKNFNLASLHQSDGLINEVLEHSNYFYLRAEKQVSKLSSNDVTKSNSIATFERKDEKRLHIPESFWNSSLSK